MPVIEATHVRKQYGDHVALKDVSFAVERGEVFGILGPNGAGKTTIVECIEGLRKPDGGSVSVLGHDPQRDRALVRQKVGIQLQESALPDNMKVWEALDLYSSFYDDPADWRQLLDEWGLAEKRNARFGKLSGGQKQRLFIALALVGKPEIAVLDELTTGLDPQARQETWSLIEGIKDKGVTVLLVTHFMEEAERLCDRVAVIARGSVAAVDTPEGLVARVGAGQRLQFKPSAPVEDAFLAGLTGVTAVRRTDDVVEVSGDGDLLQVVTSALARRDVIPRDLSVESASLEDAFVALTSDSQRVTT
ncbi:ABC transporter ATP-binding protein [Streptomyces sp. NPDC048612]|uniref:ABC transporter ATP-binding protein n=1 Tax=Streptomyces sp. NPDC048612 TaxID=3365579 RepID=UPI00371B40C3